MNPLFTWLTSVGLTPFGAIGWACLAVVAWVNLRWRVKSLELAHKASEDRRKEDLETHAKRHDRIEQIVEEQVKLTRAVELNNAELKVICAVTERRLTLVEDRVK